MAGLAYREDMDEVRARLTAWWHGGDIGRPVMQITAPREPADEPVPPPPARPQPEGWVTHYSTRDYAYRVNCGARAGVGRIYLGEAVPAASPDLAPNSLALFLGCRGVEQPGTVWCEPFIDDPDRADFDYDPDNFYWDFCLRLGRELRALGQGRFLVAFPDLIEGLDTLAALRDTERLLTDLIDRPEWVRACLHRITQLYFRHYDVLYDLFRDEVGGSIFWVWGPGRTAKLQCDFSAMIGPDMFGEFMVPVLREMTERISYCLYHWDGPGAIPHHDHLLSIDTLQVLQWTPGAGVEHTPHKRWWPLYHKTVEAGKSVMIGGGGLEELKALKREFGPKLNRFILNCGAESVAQAQDMLAAVSD